jgi:cation:H+ antiporter
VVALVTVPSFLYRWGAVHSSPGLEALFLGLALLGAAFLLSWGAELAQLDISQGFALAILALIAVLPEYAVDMVFAWKAGADISYAPLALANMTGANRLLIGLGWPMVLFIFFLKSRKRSLLLEKSHYTELFYLMAATVYAFAIPFKRELSFLDAIVLVMIFAAYIVRSSRAKVEEPQLFGPAAMIAEMKPVWRRLVTCLLFAYSGVVIFVGAEPFADSLVNFGRLSGIDEFLLVQWLAPLASEAPEFMIAAIWTFRGNAQSALGALISSKVNQWTLLVGTLPIVFSLSAGAIGALPLDMRQDHEIWLTAGQSIFAIAILSNLRISWYGAVLLVILFLAQLIVAEIRIEVMFIYLLFALVILARDRAHLLPMLKTGLRFKD